MKRVIEKSDTTIGLPGPAGPTLDALAVISVALASIGAMLVAGGASWRVSAYVSITAVLFDLLFSYELFIRILRGERPFPWIAACSSLLPLLLVSGPFLSGWVLADFEASAVRGLWLARPPIGGLAVISALRLLRLVRPFSKTDRFESRSGDRHRKARTGAGLVGIAVLLMGAACADVLLIPGIAWSSDTRRNASMQALSAAASDSERVSLTEASGVLALRLNGRILKSAAPTQVPGQYAHEALGGIEAWFSVRDEGRVRAAIAAIVMLASLASAAGYAASVFKTRQSRGTPLAHRIGIRTGRDGSLARTEPRSKPADTPAGSEELAGILGKPLP
ncbi:hypothetical protein MASR2M48_28400 [Spirochaetota bacterium]